MIPRSETSSLDRHDRMQFRQKWYLMCKAENSAGWERRKEGTLVLEQGSPCYCKWESVRGWTGHVKSPQPLQDTAVFRP
ncbi:Hypothetical predicted protein, partial [Podarcis lilfordi]